MPYSGDVQGQVRWDSEQPGLADMSLLIAEDWTRWPLRVPSNPNTMILWLGTEKSWACQTDLSLSLTIITSKKAVIKWSWKYNYLLQCTEDQNLICFLVQYSTRGKLCIVTEKLITIYLICITTKFLRQLILSWQQWRACLQVSGSSGSCSCKFSHCCCVALKNIHCRYFVFFVCLFVSH